MPWLAGAWLLAVMLGADADPLAPPFPTRDARHWIGEVQSWDGLRGKVVLLDVWTFG
jgi:hypothetical protein